MTRPLVIALIGIDGAGKSTQARGLAAALNTRGVRARYWMNPGGRLRLDRVARRLGQRDAMSMFGRYGFLVIEILVRWFMIARALLWSRLSGRVAVMDRYTICEYAVIRARRLSGERLARTLYVLFPPPDVVFFLAATPAEAERRIHDRGDDREDVAYLKALEAAYRSLPEASTYTVVDADGTPSEVQAAIRDVVDRHIPVRETVG